MHACTRLARCLLTGRCPPPSCLAGLLSLWRCRWGGSGCQGVPLNRPETRLSLSRSRRFSCISQGLGCLLSCTQAGRRVGRVCECLSFVWCSWGWSWLCLGEEFGERVCTLLACKGACLPGLSSVRPALQLHQWWGGVLP